MTFRTEVVQELAAFGELRSEWEDLLERSDMSTVFQSWEWLSAWWGSFGSPAGLRIVLARDSSGRLVGAAPLHIRRTTYYRLPVRELSFIGDGYSDRQDLVLAGDRVTVARALLDHVAAMGNWDILRLEPVPEGSALLAEPVRSPRNVEECSSSPYLPVVGRWDDFHKGLSKKFRADIRNKTHHLDKRGAWAVRRLTAPEDCRALIEEMRGLERRSHKQTTGTAFFSRRGAPEFMASFLALARERGWIHYSAIDLEGDPICYLLGFVRKGTYVAYSMAFSQDVADASPGKLLIHDMIRWYFEHPGTVEEFDLSRGETYIKSLWCSETRRHWRMVRFRRGAYPALIRGIVFELRPLFKRILRPEATPAGDADQG